MTANDVPRAGASGGRRRALGRGPGASPAATPPTPVPDAAGPGPEPDAAPPATDPRLPAAEAGPDRAADVPRGAAEPCGTTTGAARTVAAPGATDPVPTDPVPTDPGAAHSAPGPAPADHGRSRPGADAEAVPGDGPATGDRGAAPADRSVPGGAAEGEGDDRVFTVRLANFEGPFDLLLQLISRHKMDVTEVALSEVTDEFMAHIKGMGPDWDLDRTTEFLVVAATLLDLKAARLLPAAEVEDEADLALLEARDLLFARLLQYRAYRRVADIFSGRLDDEARRHPRTVGLEPHHAALLPEVVIGIGAERFAELAVRATRPRPRPQVYVEHVHAPLVSVREQAGVVVARLKELGEASFRTLVADTDDTLTVVARFLALLELYREKAVALEQEAALGELLVRWTGGDGAAEAAVTDEFDRPPEQPEEESST